MLGQRVIPNWSYRRHATSLSILGVIMKSWTAHLVDSQHIDSIYHADIPDLNEVDIHEIVFNRDGPTISITLNLNEYPINPPQKWVDQKFNTVQVKIALIDIEGVELSGWINTTYIARVDINKTDEKITLNLTSDDLKLSVLLFESAVLIH